VAIEKVVILFLEKHTFDNFGTFAKGSNGWGFVKGLGPGPAAPSSAVTAHHRAAHPLRRIRLGRRAWRRKTGCVSCRRRQLLNGSDETSRARFTYGLGRSDG
jgi:hypothetical protein